MQLLHTLLFHPSGDQSGRTGRNEDDAALQQVRAEAQRREAALVERMRADDAAAFAEVMAEYTARLIRFAESLVRSRDLAEDVVQNVFVQVWERRATLDPERPLKAYLFRAVQNRAFDERKAHAVRERYRQQVQEDAAAASGEAMVPSPEGEILTVAAIRAALEQLPERRRLALRLRLEEMSHAEIGEVMGLSAVAVQSLVARALADLRDLLRA